MARAVDRAAAAGAAGQLSANLAIALGAAGAALAAVARGGALDRALEAAARDLPGPERAAAQDIAYRACRRLNLLDAIVGQLMHKPNVATDGLIKAALSDLIDHGATRAHTITDQAVVCATGIAGGAFKALVNGVLRRFLREQHTLLPALHAREDLRLAYPPWWIAEVRGAWPAQWQAILAAGNLPPAQTLRVNQRRASIEAYAALLADAGISARRTGPAALTLAQPLPVARLPGFAQGLVSVQDLGAQWAGYLTALHLAPVAPDSPADGGGGGAVARPLRILDACAAPGGKTAHLLEQFDCQLTALDKDAARLDAVQRNLARLGLAADCRAVDAAVPDTWWDGTPFDFVLLDAPCTASGVVSRHPDGKWLKRPGDSAQLARVQRRLLDALWRTVRPGGTLLYATCSLFPAENARQIEAWLASHADAGDARYAPNPDSASLAGLGADRAAALAWPLQWHDGQLLPGPQHGGFFYALLYKN